MSNLLSNPQYSKGIKYFFSEHSKTNQLEHNLYRKWDILMAEQSQDKIVKTNMIFPP